MARENSSCPKPTLIAGALVYEDGYISQGFLRRGERGGGDRTFLSLPDHSHGFS